MKNLKLAFIKIIAAIIGMIVTGNIILAADEIIPYKYTDQERQNGILFMRFHLRVDLQQNDWSRMLLTLFIT